MRRPSSSSGPITETEQPPISKGSRTPYSHGAPPQNTTRDTVECLLQIHKAHVDWLGKLPINPQAPCGGYRAGPVQCSTTRDENRIVPPESEGSTIGHEFSSPVPWRRDLPGEAEKCDPPVVGTHSPVPLFKRGTTTPVCHTRGTVPNLHAMLQKACQPRQPTTSRDFEVLRADLIHPGALPPTAELTNYLSDFGLGDGRVHLRDPSLRFLIPHWKASRWD
ncbi:hypothetical protein L3Q82_008034 [Scortum barcoo]|uniref:Uncharacterized protein n=1 Tax=Scortum barcoo TaxID=214431 RepID=A0ACB8WKR1_9TELE|nr:hypothetical protein L3Q82_008034 [Scortum barcoo]